MQKHCSHCTSIWGDITCREMTVKKVSFKFLFKCRQCHWWRHLILTEDCCRFLPPQHRTLENARSPTVWRRVCAHSKIRWWRRTQTLSTWKIGDMAQAVTQIRRCKTPQTPKCQYCLLQGLLAYWYASLIVSVPRRLKDQRDELARDGPLSSLL